MFHRSDTTLCYMHPQSTLDPATPSRKPHLSVCFPLKRRPSLRLTNSIPETSHPLPPSTRSPTTDCNLPPCCSNPTLPRPRLPFPLSAFRHTPHPPPPPRSASHCRSDCTPVLHNPPGKTTGPTKSRVSRVVCKTAESLAVQLDVLRSTGSFLRLHCLYQNEEKMSTHTRPI